MADRKYNRRRWEFLCQAVPDTSQNKNALKITKTDAGLYRNVLICI